MARRREQTIFFPWERRSGWLKLPWLRSRALYAGLAMIVVVLLLGARERHKTGLRTTRATMIVVRDAIDAYRSDREKSCPPSLAALREEGYLQVDAVDAWGRPLVLTCPGRRNPGGYDLASYGPSGDMRDLDLIE
jgi:general secretion pathway protein G